MFASWKLSTKLFAGFGAMIVLSAALGYVGWSSLQGVAETAQLADATNDTEMAVSATGAARRDFAAYGFAEKPGSGETYDQLWLAGMKKLEEQIAHMESLPFNDGDRVFIKQARQATSQYRTGVESTLSSRRDRDTAAKGFADVGWKITGQIGEVSERVLAPARKAASAAQDYATLTHLDEVTISLDEKVVQRYMLMRITGVYLMLKNNADAMKAYEEAYADAVKGVEEWQELVGDNDALASGAKTLLTYFGQHHDCGNAYWKALEVDEGVRGELVASAGDVVAQCGKLRASLNEQKESVMTRAVTTTLAVSIAAVVIGLGLAFSITAGITKPINRIVQGLRDGAEQVADASGQVAGASQQLAEGASEQASSLEETSSALEEMSAMTRKTAENASEANQLSQQACTAARNGDQTMARLNEAMDGINESAGQIGKIIKVIEEIAFQTNLLALNAAVEAARAGEHGKGFAVVADEVRNLAMRAGTAAGETTQLIEGAISRVREGTTVAGDVGEALAAIVQDIENVSRLINGIASASQDQAQGVDQVSTAVNQMDKVTQQNAASAEESASAAEELSAQAATVRSIVVDLNALVHGAGAREEDDNARPTVKKVMKPATPVASYSASKVKSVSKPSNEGWDKLSSEDLSEF